MIVILGTSGYIGCKFSDYFNSKGIKLLGLSRKFLDYTDKDKFSKWLKDRRVDFVINAAGYTGKPNVDACELAKTDCLEANAVFPGMLRELFEDFKIKWGHISSGCIYSGRKPNGEGWSEIDKPNFSFSSPPCSFYSGTKALGEELLVGADNCFVWRLRIPFNHETNPRNYLQKILNYKSILDVENSISELTEFVEKCVDCIFKDIEPGVYNLTNSGTVMTRQISQWMLEEGVTNKKFTFFESEAEFMKKGAKTPRSSCVLDISKSRNAGIGMRPVEEAIRKSLKDMLNGT